MTKKDLVETLNSLNKKTWIYISSNSNLSEKFIKDFKDKVDWPTICQYQSLSESFIEEFSDKVNWPTISMYQDISDKFIYKHLGKLDLEALQANEFIRGRSHVFNSRER